MSKCLKTSLVDVFSGEQSPKLGEAWVLIKSSNVASDANFISYKNTGKTCVARIVSGTGHFGTTGDDQTMNIAMDGTSKNIRFTAETDCIVGFPNKYDIIEFGQGSSNRLSTIIKAEDLIYSSPYMQTFTSRIEGKFNIEDFNSSCVVANTASWLTGADLYGDATEYIKDKRQQAIRDFFSNYMTADLSKVTTNVNVMFSSPKGVFSWKTVRDTSMNIMAFNPALGYSYNFGDDIDAMLINQAQCQVGTRGSDAYMFYIAGNRTSASDSAVATLKSLGFTIIVNDTTL